MFIDSLQLNFLSSILPTYSTYSTWRTARSFTLGITSQEPYPSLTMTEFILSHLCSMSRSQPELKYIPLHPSAESVRIINERTTEETTLCFLVP